MDNAIVTIELVGEENYKTDSACRRAVDCRLPVSDFIQYLLEENRRLLEGWVECEKLSKTPSILKFNNPKTILNGAKNNPNNFI